MSASSSTHGLPTFVDVYGTQIDVNQTFKLVDLETYSSSSTDKLFAQARAIHGAQEIRNMFTAVPPPGGRLVIPNAQPYIAGDTNVIMAIKKDAKDMFMETEKDTITLASLLSNAFSPKMRSVGLAFIRAFIQKDLRRVVVV